MRKLVFALLSVSAAFGQSATFDVASINPSPPQDIHGMQIGMSGGPATSDPELFKCSNCTLELLITRAFDMNRIQVIGPAWLASERFDIVARLPKGATKEQFLEMQRNLLKDRFKLTAHHEKKDMALYEMVVAKGGLKMKEFVPKPAAAPDVPKQVSNGSGGKLAMEKDGLPVIPITETPFTIIMRGRARSQAANQTMEQLAAMLTYQLGRPVTDATGLKGRYDYKVSWEPEGTADWKLPPGAPEVENLPDLLHAVQEQLGLRLDSKKGPVDVLVIDSIEKTPSEN